MSQLTEDDIATIVEFAKDKESGVRLTALIARLSDSADTRYEAYAQGHRDACQDEACVLKPGSEYPTYGQGFTDGMAAEICGLSGNYGPHMEPLACAYPKGHDGPHATHSLPTFVNGDPVSL